MEVVEGVWVFVFMCQLGKWEAEMLRSGRVGVFDPETLIKSERTRYCLAIERVWQGSQRKYIG
jgi:hypothetical protein